MLAVNVELLPKGMTISRRHAQITFIDDRYYIEPLAENNPVYVNGKEMPMGSMWEIKTGDKVTFGRYDVTLDFFTMPHSGGTGSHKHAAPAAAVKFKPNPPPPQVVQSQPAASQAIAAPAKPAISQPIPQVVPPSAQSG